MTDKPILFSGPMVRALLDGRKTQTRRVLKPQPDFRGGAGDYLDAEEWGWENEDGGHLSVLDIAPNGFNKGDNLWVRETWTHSHDHKFLTAYRADGRCGAWAWDGEGAPVFFPHGYVLDPLRRDHLANFGRPRYGANWRSSIHMPRWASRLTLTVIDVQVQRVQEISHSDALSEGVEMESADPPFYYVPGILPHSLTAVGVEEGGGQHAERSFGKLWDSLNAKRGFGWEKNPWVVALTFAVEQRNIDAVARA